MRLFALALGAALTLGVAVACSSFTAEDDAPTAAEGGPPGDVDGALEAAGEAAPDAGPPYTVLGTDFIDLSGVDTNGTAVFVVERTPGRISAIDLDAGGRPQTLNGDALSPSAVVAFADGVVVGDYGHATLTAFLVGGTALPPAQPADMAGPAALTRTPGGGFVVATQKPDGTGTVTEWARPATEGLLDYQAQVAGNLFDVAATATDVYWTESAKAMVWRRQIANGSASPIPMATQEHGCESIAADSEGVYWTLPDEGKVRTTGPIGATDFALSEATPFSLAVDGSGVYWLTASGSLRRARRDGSPVETLASGFASDFADRHVQAIALSERYIVWITTDGRVLRLAK